MVASAVWKLRPANGIDGSLSDRLNLRNSSAATSPNMLLDREITHNGRARRLAVDVSKMSHATPFAVNPFVAGDQCRGSEPLKEGPAMSV